MTENQHDDFNITSQIASSLSMKEPGAGTTGLHGQITDPNRSALKRYQSLVIGSDSLWALVKFEVLTLFFSWVPGALGLMLRKLLYPSILGSIGKNVIIGHGVTIRHGSKIHLSDNVVVDDYAALDAKGEANVGIHVRKNTMISRNAVLSCKDGNIIIGEECSVGINCLIHASNGSDVTLGNHVLIGAFSYVVGSGPYRTDRLSAPFKKQGIVSRGGISIKDNVWVGSSTQILDGASIGTGVIIGSGSVVNRDVEALDVVAGVPIRTIRTRG